MNATEAKSTKALTWMIEKGADVYGDGTAIQFKGNMPWYTVQALHDYFRTNDTSTSIDCRTVIWGDWNVTLSAGKFTSSQHRLTVCFNRTNEWYAKRELESKGFLPKEAETLVGQFTAKGKEAFLAFCTLIENGLVTPESYGF